jgi:two-component system chemotaxis response regulator CheB
MRRPLPLEFEMKTVRDVVVIGAAMGGLTAIAQIALNWPRELPVSVLIALSTQDQPAATVLQIIESYAHVRVSFAVDGEAVKVGRIYVSPLGKHLTVGRFGIIRLEKPGFFDTVQPSINRLFAAAAVVYGPRVIGVVLSGEQYDGVQGMRDIEAAGGIGIVQDPDDASSPQMPRHVVRNDSPRYCVKASEIAPLLQRLVAGKT